jgi:DNA-binding MarR family transcriptional regulator
MELTRPQLQRRIIDRMRWYVVQSEHVAHTFARRHGLHPTDMAALIAVLEAEGLDDPLTPGSLAARLRLSSAATTAVVDRLERSGHLHRDRSSADRRRVHLRYAPAAMALAREFFGPLGARANRLMADFDEAELAVVLRFVDAMTTAMEQHAAHLDR